MEWVELLYSLHAAKCINEGKISLKEMFDIMGKLFNIEVSEFSIYFRNIRGRIKQRTRFLDKLKNHLLERITNPERKIPKFDDMLKDVKAQYSAQQTVVDCPFRNQDKTAGKLKWTSSRLDFAELIYALHETYSINNGSIFLSDLFDTLCDSFDFKIESFTGCFMEIKKRKINHTIFIDSLKSLLLRRMEEADQKPSRK